VAYPKLALAFEFRKGDQQNGHAILDLYIEGLPNYVLSSRLLIVFRFFRWGRQNPQGGSSENYAEERINARSSSSC
jgi:hypothetical protein